MSRLVKCPQQHIWLPTGNFDSPAALTCPVCGEIGAELPAEAPNSTIAPDKDDVTAVATVKSDQSASHTKSTFAPPVIPGYEIVRELGRGGMGVVYLARHQQLKRLVALKMILAGAHAGPDALARFHREAEAVARLQHPGITQIYDVGEQEGRPFLALEYIDGGSLADRLAEATLKPRASAALVEALARTIHFAHQCGIVHRDLTPRNILLGKGGSLHSDSSVTTSSQSFEPKITDFGLAKELDADHTQTMTGAVLGTPSYMSPEQAQGKTHEIGPRSDVYALGAILYQTLTGRPPYLAATTFDTLKQVIEREPVLPTRLQPSVPRDLETICLKCLAKDAQKRYSSAEDLANDLHRFLASEPIHARRVPWPERTWKWARRQPAVAALIVVVLLAAAGFGVGSVVYNARVRGERDRAEHNFQLAMRAVDEMLTEVGQEQLASEPRMEEKRRALLANALAFYQEFLKEKSNDSRVRLETAQAYRRLADVQRLLGQNGAARDAYDQAIRLLLQLLDESPSNVNHRQQLAYCYSMSGEAARLAGQFAEADAAYLDAESILEELLAERPGDLTVQQELSRTKYNRGILLRQAGKFVDAENQFQAAIKLLADTARSSTSNPLQRQHLARAYLNLGTVIPATSRFGDANTAYDRAIEILTELSEQFPENPDYRHELGVAQSNLGNLFLRDNRPEQAKTAYSEALKQFRALERDFPKVPVYRQELANSLNSVGSVAAGQKDNPAAKEAWQEAATLLEQLAFEHCETPAYRGDLGMVLANLGLAKYADSQWPQARMQFEKSIGILQAVVDENANQAQYRQVLRDDYQNLAETLLALHVYAEAASAARSLAKVMAENGRDHYLAACFLARCAAEAERDSDLEPTQRDSAMQQYGDEAISELRSSVEHGFHDAQQFEQDRKSVFQGLTMRPDFQQLVDGLSAIKSTQ